MIKEKEKTDLEFITCKYDCAMKEVFGNEKNKDLLICLLESILPYKIKDVTYLNVEHPIDNVHLRRKIFDLNLKTNIGYIQIEINTTFQNYLVQRNTAFICDNFSHATFKGAEYDKNLLFIQLNFNYGMRKNDKALVHTYKFLETKTNDALIDNLIIYYFHMDNILDLWYNKDEKGIEENKFLIMLNLSKDELASFSKKNRMVKRYMEELVRLNQDPEFRRAVSFEKDNMMIRNSIKREAREEGVAEGLAKGKTEGKKEIAITMLKQKLDINTISKYTGLSLKDIRELQ